LKTFIIDLKVGEKGIIVDYDKETIPLKLIEMGCIEGSEVYLVNATSLNDPIYLNINETFIAIRKDMASMIEIKKL
jgi:ferrous iron transport protein A